MIHIGSKLLLWFYSIHVWVKLDMCAWTILLAMSISHNTLYTFDYEEIDSLVLVTSYT